MQDLIILGAGVAGLTAARALALRGIKATILEARHRTGGRILSHGNIELGAEFVHGRAPELWAVLDEMEATTTERDGKMMRAQDGLVAEDDDAESGALFEPLEALKDLEPDQPFAEWLAASDVPEADRPGLTAYVEGFNAADAARISARSLGAQQIAEEEIEGWRSWHLHGGYQQLTDYLTAECLDKGVLMELNAEAFAVIWHKHYVEVATCMGSFTAKRCLVTLPLGVLQSGKPSFVPAPKALVHANRMAMGHATRITLVFREAFWPAETSFLFTRQHTPPVWWTANPEVEQHPTLTGWIGGTHSAALAGFSTEDLTTQALLTLAETFHLHPEALRSNLLEAHHHNWSTDPFSLGAYSYVAAGAMDAPMAMTQPEEDTIFFAGEHTDVTGHWGTVHAALRSGLRAAAQILGEE